MVSGNTILETVGSEKTAHNNATNLREVQFKPLAKLCTRIINALDASGASKEMVKDARGFVNKIQGRRAGKKEEAPVQDPNNPIVETPNYISVSHTSFDNRIANFQGLIQLLNAASNYQPNEPELSQASLANLLHDLKLVHQAAKQTEVALSNARIERDKILYLDDNCICESALDVKKYIKSIFGANSQQHKQVGKLSFVVRASTV